VANLTCLLLGCGLATQLPIRRAGAAWGTVGRLICQVWQQVLRATVRRRRRRWRRLAEQMHQIRPLRA